MKWRWILLALIVLGAWLSFTGRIPGAALHQGRAVGPAPVELHLEHEVGHDDFD